MSLLIERERKEERERKKGKLKTNAIFKIKVAWVFIEIISIPKTFVLAIKLLKHTYINILRTFL